MPVLVLYCTHWTIWVWYLSYEGLGFQERWIKIVCVCAFGMNVVICRIAWNEDKPRVKLLFYARRAVRIYHYNENHFFFFWEKSLIFFVGVFVRMRSTPMWNHTNRSQWNSMRPTLKSEYIFGFAYICPETIIRGKHQEWFLDFVEEMRNTIATSNLILRPLLFLYVYCSTLSVKWALSVWQGSANCERLPLALITFQLWQRTQWIFTFPQMSCRRKNRSYEL